MNYPLNPNLPSLKGEGISNFRTPTSPEGFPVPSDALETGQENIPSAASQVTLSEREKDALKRVRLKLNSMAQLPQTSSPTAFCEAVLNAISEPGSNR